MDELSAMVDAFVTKAGMAAPGGQAAQDMEQFFALKQEEKQIDDALGSHEDELEYLYKTGSPDKGKRTSRRSGNWNFWKTSWMISRISWNMFSALKISR